MKHRTLEFDITPVAKPRMLRADKWKKRPVVLRYFAFADELRLLARSKKYNLAGDLDIVFELEMPESWSRKKRKEMFGKPHQQKPDLDNLIKAVADSLLIDDSGLWRIEACKKWGLKGKIIIYD